LAWEQKKRLLPQNGQKSSAHLTKMGNFGGLHRLNNLNIFLKTAWMSTSKEALAGISLKICTFFLTSPEGQR
jgi:hypothetical protein